MVETMSGYDDYKNEINDFRASIPSRQKVYWVFVNRAGRWVDISYKPTEAEAYEMGYSQSGGNHFEVIGMNTTDISESHRRFKKWLLNRGSGIDEATSLISRKPAEQKKKEEVKRDKPFGEGLF